MKASEGGLKSRRMERFPLLLREEGVILPPKLTIQDQDRDGGVLVGPGCEGHTSDRRGMPFYISCSGCCLTNPLDTSLVER